MSSVLWVQIYRTNTLITASSLAYVFSQMHQANTLWIVIRVSATRAMCSKPYAATALENVVFLR